MTRRILTGPSRRRFAHLPLKERFLAWCSPEPNSGCWLWEGAVGSGQPGGKYGSFKVGAQGVITAPRAALLLLKCEEVPKGKVVAHTCDLKLCVNPEHLYITTQSENIRDAWRRGTGKITRQSRVLARREARCGL